MEATTGLTTREARCEAARAALDQGDQEAWQAHVEICKGCQVLEPTIKQLGPASVTEELRRSLERHKKTGELLFGRYCIVDIIDAGGQGAVARATDPEFGDVAVKLVWSNSAAVKQPDRFALDVRHPGVCRIYNIERRDPLRLVAMELIEGENLEKAGPSFSLQERLRIFREICTTVLAIHEKGLLHLDLKPKNILLLKGNRPIIADFGLAAPLGASSHRAEPFGWTDGYSPPEQLALKPVDRRADVYALGKTLQSLIPDAPSYIRKVASRATKDQEQERYRDVNHLLADLRLQRVWPVAARALGFAVAAILAYLALTKPPNCPAGSTWDRTREECTVSALSLLGETAFDGATGADIAVDPARSLVFLSSGVGIGGVVRLDASNPRRIVRTSLPDDLQQDCGVAVDSKTGRYATTSCYGGHGVGSRVLVYNADDSLYDSQPLAGCGGALESDPATARFFISTQCDDHITVYGEKEKSLLASASASKNGSTVIFDSSTGNIFENRTVRETGVTAPLVLTSTYATSTPLAEGIVAAVNPTSGKLYVLLDGRLEIRDDTSFAVINTIPDGAAPVVVDTALNRFYTFSKDAGSILVHDGVSEAVVAAIDLPGGYLARNMSMARGNDRLYVVAAKPDQKQPGLLAYRTGGATWSRIVQAGTGPERRNYGATTVRDPRSGRVILFGGKHPTRDHSFNDAFALDSSVESGRGEWAVLTQNGAAGSPPGRNNHSAVYDSINNRMIIGTGCGGGCLPIVSDYWILTNISRQNGGARSWSRLSPRPDAAGGSPPAAHSYAMAFDDASNRLVVWGGHNGLGTVEGNTRSETWILTNANGLGGEASWIRVHPRGGPPPGPASPGHVYDTRNHRLIIAGGAGDHGSTNQVWVLRGVESEAQDLEWIRLNPEGAPPPAWGGSPAVYDPIQNRMILFLATRSGTEVWVLTNANGLGGTPAWVHHLATPPTAATIGSGQIVYDPAADVITAFLDDGSSNLVWTLRHTRL